MNELELKFSTPDGVPPDEDELKEALAQHGLELGALSTIHNEDRYYDDPRLSLNRAGLALRRRVSEGKAVATLKTRGRAGNGLHEREEIELPVELPDFPTPLVPWPAAIRDRVAVVTPVGLLQPRTVVETERTQYAVLAEGRPVAVLAFDKVTGRPQMGQRSVGFDEVEIEAHGSSDEALLRRIAAAVETVITLVPNSSSKLERVRELLMMGSFEE